jgi:PKD repeat protein
LFALMALALAGPAVANHDEEDNERPTASFTVSPSSPVTGELVTFNSTSSDEDGSITSQAWDLDNDGSFDDGSCGPNPCRASRTFSTSGSYVVRLRVVDDHGASRTTSRTVSVATNRAPVAAFSANPTDPLTNQTVTLTSSSSDPDGRPLVQEWDLNNDGVYGDKTGAQVTTSYPDNGVKRINLRVTDSGGSVRTTFRDITVRNRSPLASFTVSDSDVDTGEEVDFTSTSNDPDGQVTSYAWDFDGDDETDATGPSASHSFPDDGEYTVTLTVTDDDGASRSSSEEVRVRNRAPTASFQHSPQQPTVGDEVVLTSTSTDPDGTVEEHRWDLDGDGAFDDATGPEARKTFTEERSYTVALQVEDDDGRKSAPAFTSLEVTRRPPPPPPGGDPSGGSQGSPAPQGTTGPTVGVAAPRLLAPFPLVRIRGVTTARGVRLDLLSVRTIRGTRIVVRCRGGGCPWRVHVQRVSFRAPGLRSVRVPGFRRRHLRAGTVLEVFVTRSGMIGKYTRFKIRRMRPPMRTDGCTAPGAARPRKCPS